MFSKLIGPAAVALIAAAFTLPSSAVAATATPPAPTPVPAKTATPDTFADDRRVLRGSRTVFGQSFVLRSNETLRGDLAVFGGDATLERGSIVEGDLAVFGGNMTIERDTVVDGDVAVFGGNLRIAGRITGDLAHVGGNIDLADSAQVLGRSLRIGEEGIDEEGVIVGIPSWVPAQPFTSFGRWANEESNRWMGSGVWKVFPGSLLITLAALLIWVVFPRRIERATAAAEAQPLFVGGVGVLTLFVGSLALAVSLVLIVTLCTNPLIAVAAVSASWTVAARIVGERIVRLFEGATWSPAARVAVGSAVMALLGAIPFVGDLLGFAFVALGLGALTLTRLGTREWQPMQKTATTPTADR